ncbi:MAG: hypothetical protein ABIQ58_05020 [Candidatus Limnocylindrales bacterium]
MSIHIEVFMAEGVASGQVAGAGHLREVLEVGGNLLLERATWRATGATGPGPVGPIAIAIDDILVAIGDDDPTIPVHASWHAIRLEMGPYVVEGELPTLPGYDPGRALTRPTGEFLLLRDVRLGWVGGDGASSLVGHTALVNRYCVERVSADLMLGFYFPGAELEAPDGVSA